MANGTYIHTPKPYNPNVYIQESWKYALYYYPEKIDSTIGSWRITELLYLETSADLQSRELGCGLWYPAMKIPNQKKYEKRITDKGWSLEFV